MKMIPPYLREVLEEATEYYESESNVSHIDAAHEIAHQNSSLVRMDTGTRDALNVLRDVQRVHSICADEFETYRSMRSSEHADSILEALALRSLEELINVYLDENQSFNSGPATPEREIEYDAINNPNLESNILIHITGKEAVDIDNALASFVSKASGHPSADAVASFNRLWKGGVSGLDDTSVMLTTAGDVSILLAALTEYEPREADYTTRLRQAVLDAIAAPESPIDPDDVEPFNIDEQPATAD
jgi:hypothetical protein